MYDMQKARTLNFSFMVPYYNNCVDESFYVVIKGKLTTYLVQQRLSSPHSLR